MEPVQHLRSLLLQRLSVLEARRHLFDAGWHEAQEWINSSRLIFVLDGRLEYTLNGIDLELSAGEALLVPVDAQRSWRVAVEQHCELAWFRYEVQQDPPAAPPPALHRQGVDGARAAAAVERLAGLVADPAAAGELVAEAEAKLLLARFFASARPLSPPAAAVAPPDAGRGGGDRVVVDAVRYLNTHYARPDALASLTGGLPVSAAHFRKLFRRQVGCTPRDHLTRRRMQVARHRLYHAHEQVKQVAAAVGYADPLYFSRAYAAFWGHPPTTDQHRRWTPSDGPTTP